MKVTIEWKRKNNCVIYLDDDKWLSSIANMLEAGLLKGVAVIWIWNLSSEVLWKYELPET